MQRTEKQETNKGIDPIDPIANMSLSINYGDIIASVKADRKNYIAKITGKVGEVEGITFHHFVMRFIQSIENASRVNKRV